MAKNKQLVKSILKLSFCEKKFPIGNFFIEMESLGCYVLKTLQS